MWGTLDELRKGGMPETCRLNRVSQVSSVGKRGALDELRM